MTRPAPGRTAHSSLQVSTLSVEIDDREPSPARDLGPGAAAAPRYVLLLLVLLLAGGFSGQQVHLVAWGAEYDRLTKACVTDAEARFPVVETANPVDPLGNAEQVSRLANAALSCIAVHQRKQAAAAVVGAFSVLAIGLLLMFLLPALLLRRAGPLRPAPRLQARAEALAGSLGLRRAPEVRFGGLHLREPFTAAGLGRTQVVLPRAVAALPAAEADAVLAHELAHVGGRDVRVVWLTRGVWWALPVALIAPAALALAQRAGVVTNPYAGTAVQPIGLGYWAEVGAYSVGLLLLAVLVAFRVLRCREHLADLRSSQVLGAAGLSSLLGRHPSPEGPRWRRFTATHPSSQHRISALRAPGAALGVSALDALLAGILAGQVFAFATILTNLAVGSTWPRMVVLGPAVITAVLLSLTWVPMVWRSAAHRDGSSRWAAVAIVGLSTGVGLSTVAHPWRNGIVGGAALVLTPWMVAGAGVLTVALARVVIGRSGAGGSRAGALLVGSAAGLLLLAAFTLSPLVALAVQPPTDLATIFLGVRTTMFGPAVIALLLTLSPLAWWAMRARAPRRGAAVPAWRQSVFTVVAAAAAAVATAQAAGVLTVSDGNLAVLGVAWTAAAAGIAAAIGAYAHQGSSAGATALVVAAPATGVTVAAATAVIGWQWQWGDPLLGARLAGQHAASLVIVALLVLVPLLALLPSWSEPAGRLATVARSLLAPVLAAALVLLSLLL